MTAITEQVSERTFVYPAQELFKDVRAVWKKVGDHAMSIIREIRYVVTSFYDRFRDNQRLISYEPCEKEKIKQHETKRLVVMAHGLKSHPRIWKHHIRQLEKMEGIDFIAPHLFKAGNAPLEEVFPPFFQPIAKWALDHPGLPITIWGFSLGGILALQSEEALRTIAPLSPVDVSAIGSPILGTSRMNFVDAIFQRTGRQLGFHPDVIKNLKHGSQKMKETLSKVQKPLPAGVIRSFTFYASTEDFAVPEISSSIPKVGSHPSSHVILHGYNHGSLVRGVVSLQMQELQNRLKTFQIIVPVVMCREIVVYDDRYQYAGQPAPKQSAVQL